MLKPGDEVSHGFGKNRHGWLQVARGIVDLNSWKPEQGDGAALNDEKAVTIQSAKDSEMLLFDLAEERFSFSSPKN